MGSVLLLLLAGCVEYGITPEPTPTYPDIVVSPGTLALTGACDAEPGELVVTNDGSAPLTLATVAAEGADLVDAPDLPAVIAPGESLLLSLLIAPGTGFVLLGSDDPDAPVLAVPIAAEGNEHPVVAILSPYEDQRVPAEGTFALSALVSDAEDAAPTLAFQWVSSLAGPVGGIAVADEDGFVRMDWPAEARVSGPQTLVLRATDRCGAIGEQTLFYCQDGPFTYDSLVEDAWHTESAAVVDPTAGTLALGAPEEAAVGAGFDAFSLVNAEAVSATFRVRTVGEVTGFSLTALDGDEASAGWIGGGGCGLGFGGGAACTDGPALPGWSLAFYAAEGEGCLAAEHLAWTFDGDVSTWAACAPTSSLYDGGWHDVSVVVAAPRVAVSIDGAPVLDAALDSTWSFSAFLGFTAATHGAGTVEIMDFAVTDADCRQ
ncbi:MAG: hypothetical protein Q8P41_25190 [Pseudomonadota bacterium]|nr:hypothetical protein [Pseudomonadota bacterium]